VRIILQSGAKRLNVGGTKEALFIIATDVKTNAITLVKVQNIGIIPNYIARSK
jgi:phage/plasmid primase-like uncharacterized protein